MEKNITMRERDEKDEIEDKKEKNITMKERDAKDEIEDKK